MSPPIASLKTDDSKKDYGNLVLKKPVERKRLESSENWQRALAWRDHEFASNDKQHPHVRRRKDILEKYPLVRKLYGRDPMTIAIIFTAISVHLLMAHRITLFSNTLVAWICLIVCSLVIGASICGLMSICVHECCHSSAANHVLADKLLSLVCNIGTPAPIAMSFRRYHSDHHVYQGNVDKDPDLPLPWELRLISGTFLHKFIWLSIYPLMYAVRALARGKTVTRWENINLVFTIICNILCYLAFDAKGLTYLLVSFLFGYTFHPIAAHFLQEHYTFEDGQETYNYHGWANLLYLNVGFHNEHHDFPTIPGRWLPLVTKIAPEYYTTLSAHKSWKKVLFAFLTDRNIGPVSRCVRSKD